MEGVAAKEGQARQVQRACDELLRRNRRRDGGIARTRSTPRILWDLDSQIDVAMEALPLPARRRPRRQPLGRRTPPRRPSASLLLEAPDMLLLDEPTNHLDAVDHRLAAAAPHRLQGHESSSSPTTATSSTTSPGGSSTSTAAAASPTEGNYSAWLRTEGQAPRTGGPRGQVEAEDASARAGIGSARAPRPGQAKAEGPHQRL